MTLLETSVPPRGMTRASAIRTTGLRKVYPLPAQKRGPSSAASRAVAATAGSPGTPSGVVALDALDLEIRSGEFFGVLGPNGAGKTTTLGILTTRVLPTAGEARVSGLDVVRDSVGVRRLIGVVPQRPNPDRQLTVRENLLFHASYFGIPRAVAESRARELLETFEISDRAAARVDQLSGGQSQRLMIARALIHDPHIIFLDEPTGGLDPLARLALWETLRRIHGEGRTIVLTTHYMEEADRLCERVAIIDRGKLLAVDTPANLKAKAPGGTLIELTLDGEAAGALAGARALPGILRAEAERNRLRAFAERGGESIAALIRAAEQAGRSVEDVHFAPPSLETLFVSMTGRRLE